MEKKECEINTHRRNSIKAAMLGVGASALALSQIHRTAAETIITTNDIETDAVKAPTGRSATLVIAASDSSAAIQEQADHVTDDLDDGTVQTLLSGATGKVLFISGSAGFSKTAATGLSLPSDIEIELKGKMTLADGLDADACFFKNADRVNGNARITLSGGANAIYDCNRAGQSAGDQYVADFLGVNYGSIDAYITNYTVLEAKTKDSNVTIKNHRFFVKPILLSDCESISDFSVNYGTGTTEMDGGIVGSNCIKLTATDPTDTSVRADINLPDGIDAEAYILCLWVKIVDASVVRYLQIGGDTPDDGIAKPSSPNTDDVVKIIPDNEWVRLQVPLSYYTSIDPGHNTVRIRFDPTSGNTVTAYVDDIRLIPSRSTPALSFVLDDAIESSSIRSTLAAARILAKYGGRSSVAHMGSGYVWGGYLSLDELDLLYTQYEWDICAHGFLHFDTISVAEAMEQTSNVVNFLHSNGYTRGSDFFVFPGHDTTAEITTLISKIFRAYRNPLQDYVLCRAENVINYAHQVPSTGTTTYAVTDNEKQCMRRHIWTCIYAHYLGGTQMTAEWLEEFCAYWSNWGITIQPPSAIMESDGAPTLIDDVYKLSNEGAATITTSSTTVDVSHGLVAAPTRVILSPTTDTAGKRFWVSAKGATTFTISIDSAAGSDISFDWMATL